MTTRSSKPATDEASEGDGIDPRAEKKARMARGSRDKPDYAALRLARQIWDVLDLVISQCGQPRLASFVVGAVEPSAAGGNFVVQVYSTNPSAHYDPHEIKAILDEIRPRLRTEVAKEVTRKKAPDFKFDILPPGVQPK